MARVIVEWDDPADPKGNVQHIARHSVTQAEVEYVLNSLRSTSTRSHSSGLPATFGWTKTGRYIIVTYDITCHKPYTVKPKTSYPTNPPGGKP